MLGNPTTRPQWRMPWKSYESLSDEDQPWCLYLGLIGPHDPYDVPQKYLDLYDLEEIPLPESYGDGMLDKPRDLSPPA